MSNSMNRKYTLERMFTTQLLDCAKDELSFRTVVRDLKTRVPKLQIVLANSDSWSYTGYCSSTQSCMEPLPKIDLHPVIKVLFSECSNNTESKIRLGSQFSRYCICFLLCYRPGSLSCFLCSPCIISYQVS